MDTDESKKMRLRSPTAFTEQVATIDLDKIRKKPPPTKWFGLFRTARVQNAGWTVVFAAQQRQGRVGHGPFSLWRVRVPLLWALWVIAFTYGELAASRIALASCKWTPNDPKEYRLAVVADPQLTDFYSYKMEKQSWMLYLTEFYSDLYMRRHFQLLARKPDPPHGVLILGDLFDGGRILTLEEHMAHRERFEWIFGGHPSIQFWNMSGNHDVGIKQWNNERANALQRETFGLSQYSVVLGQVEVVVVDSIAMLSDNPIVAQEAIAFVQMFGSMKAKKQFPRLLFTHIPLFRPKGSDCGPRRRKEPIAPGEGVSYQNVLSPQLTTLILNAIEPTHVFSGDDHSPCAYRHEQFNVTEDSLATFSWLQGERHPELTMLTLRGSPVSQAPSLMETCALPDQMLLYFGYGFLGVASLVYLAFGTLPRHEKSSRIAAYARVFVPIVLWYLFVLFLSVL
ncbi:hypothetical protein LEN26_002339 [Aphanomyces euteiches]|nr:hypothetical protein AeMF1_005883 [Aphanomyces euteiches]KAH9159441.1 hypothetical protein LEN26_002339 [Aphanomyces euteiches]KAH9187387.1 hypothetical protein AeNC1_010633 [Aphanomyces euteiches]